MYYLDKEEVNGLREYILYGAGHDGIVTMHYLGKENVLFFCDEYRSGGVIDGIPIISPRELKEISDENTVVIAVSKPQYVNQIISKLDFQGIKYVFWHELVSRIIQSEGELYNQINKRPSFEYDPKSEYIITRDRYENAGTLDSYFWQDLWAARLIYDTKPDKHYDIGSRVDGFITHLLTFGQRVVQIDIRPLNVDVDGYEFVCADATTLYGIDDNRIDSLSALCSLEHFGLGRYGDNIDPEACFKCFDAIQRVIRIGGYAYISVPIGREHLEFNAHRVFLPQTIIDAFSEMKLIEFSSCFGTEFEKDVDVHKYDDWEEFGGKRFGLFVFQKK